MQVHISDIPVSNDTEFVVIAGPCVIESAEHAQKMARELSTICDRQGVDLVFKSSFDKANRSSIDSYRGPGLEKGLKILGNIRDDVGVPVLTDIHEPHQAAPAAEVVDVLQIPAFLSRQTDLLVAAGETGKPIHVKKGQFLSAEGMTNVVDKIASTGNEDVLLCERGAMFGYNNLVVDMRNLEIMKQTGQPVVFDATHSVQRPGSKGDESGGDREFAPGLARGALGVGVGGLFTEVHDNPPEAKSDAATQLYLEEFESYLETFVEIDRAQKDAV